MPTEEELEQHLLVNLGLTDKSEQAGTKGNKDEQKGGEETCEGTQSRYI